MLRCKNLLIDAEKNGADRIHNFIVYIGCRGNLSGEAKYEP